MKEPNNQALQEGVDVIDRQKLVVAMNDLIGAVSRLWGTGSTEHNLVRDISDIIASAPALAATPTTDRHAEGRLAGLEEAAKDLHDRADKLDPPGGKRVPMVDQHTASVMRAAATRFYNLAYGEAS